MYWRKFAKVGGWWDNLAAKLLTRTGHIATLKNN